MVVLSTPVDHCNVIILEYYVSFLITTYTGIKYSIVTLTAVDKEE
jgi:hypothetical protein